uniref:Uncharacterized protein n=1 Tax=Rhizophora mucronata TaxID=61149 RepID=A0A2P2NX16_RHIMU
MLIILIYFRIDHHNIIFSFQNYLIKRSCRS